MTEHAYASRVPYIMGERLRPSRVQEKKMKRLPESYSGITCASLKPASSIILTSFS